MSILDPINQPIRPNANLIATQMKAQAHSIYNMLVKTFNNGAKNFWTNPNATPEQLAAALGKDGKELFELHAKIGQLLATIKPEVIEEGLSVVGEFTYNDNGSINIISK